MSYLVTSLLIFFDLPISLSVFVKQSLSPSYWGIFNLYFFFTCSNHLKLSFLLCLSLKLLSFCPSFLVVFLLVCSYIHLYILIFTSFYFLVDVRVLDRSVFHPKYKHNWLVNHFIQYTFKFWWYIRITRDTGCELSFHLWCLNTYVASSSISLFLELLIQSLIWTFSFFVCI